MKKWISSCLWFLMLCSCSHDNINYTYTLQSVDTFLRYELDSDVKMPLVVRTCMGDNDYL